MPFLLLIPLYYICQTSLFQTALEWSNKFIPGVLWGTKLFFEEQGFSEGISYVFAAVLGAPIAILYFGIPLWLAHFIEIYSMRIQDEKQRNSFMNSVQFWVTCLMSVWLMFNLASFVLTFIYYLAPIVWLLSSDGELLLSFVLVVFLPWCWLSVQGKHL